ncbi:MAG: restriction endonuclease, partial [Hydrogenophaga sp.]|uniref:restriction endonuclease n=1 Tax=Hydrogenophaga sp. TaxID=1904254 RepID=UPI0025B86DDE
SHGPDGGVDVWLYSKHAQGPALVVQCKHWRSKRVGVKEVREFLGVMASNQLKRGTYATTSTFTSDAVDFARRNGIHLLDGKGLITLIAQRTPEQQQALLGVAFEGDYARPTCASCGIKMVRRTPSRGGSDFWGCSNYPRCHSRLGMTAG